MSDILVLMPGDLMHWVRVRDDAIVARGDGDVVPTAGDRIVAVVPAHDVTLRHVSLPDLSEPQALAAARLIIGEQSAVMADTLHVAVGKADAAGDRSVAALDRSKMVALLAELDALGCDPDVVVPALTLVPRPETGFVKGNVGRAMIVRGRDGAFVDDPVLTPLLVTGHPTALDAPALDRALVEAVARPEINLRQGVFAKRRAWRLDRTRIERIGVLASAVAGLTLLVSIVQLVRLDREADRIDANNRVVARAALPPGTNVNNPLLQVQERLNTMRGAGGGMLPLAAVVASATDATPNLELTALVFDGGGTLRVTARATTPTDLMIFEGKLKEAGLVPAAGPMMVDQGRQIRDYTVSAP